MRFFYSLVVGVALLLSACVGQTADNNNYKILVKNSGGDSTPALLSALEKAKSYNGKNVEIHFEKSTYLFGGDFAPDVYVFTSNNDEGLKRVIFPLIDFQNITINGNGAKFVFDGRINPFLIRNSKNIKFKNFTCDLVRSGHTEALVLDTFKGGAVLEMKPDFPFEIVQGCLMFMGKKDSITTTQKRDTYYIYRSMLEFNPQRNAIEYNVADVWANEFGAFRADFIGGRKFKLYNTNAKFKKGNIVVFSLGARYHSMFAVDECCDVFFENVTVHDAYGMGIIGQNTRNIVVDNCKFTPAKNRIVSCSADATHFVNCEGKIVLQNSLFENQMDDATNIHGIYERLAKIESANTFISELVHRQQYGFKTFAVGDEIEFVDRHSMITKTTAKIKSVEVINKQFKRIVLTAPIPQGVKKFDAIAKIRNYPEVVIQNNIIRNNRARGMLLNCRGKTLVKNNYFSTSGSALYFEGDASNWFEQGGVRDCTIINNTFENCNYAKGWGNAVIEVAAGITKDRQKSRYNRNIKIENNTFKMFDGTSLLKIFCVDNLVWKNNRVEKTTSFPPKRNLPPFITEHSSNVVLSK